MPHYTHTANPQYERCSRCFVHVCVCNNTYKDNERYCYSVLPCLKAEVFSFSKKLSFEKFLSLCSLTEIMSHLHTFPSFLHAKHRQQVAEVTNKSTTLSISALFTSIHAAFNNTRQFLVAGGKKIVFCWNNSFCSLNLPNESK